MTKTVQLVKLKDIVNSIICMSLVPSCCDMDDQIHAQHEQKETLKSSYSLYLFKKYGFSMS